MKHSFLQTPEWLEFQRAVGHRGWRFDNDKISATIIRHNVPLGKNYLYVPHGPVIDFNEVEGGLKHEIGHFFTYLRQVAHEQKSMFVKFEPLSDMITELIYPFGLRRSKKDIQPHRSVVLDISASEEQLLAAMHHKTRYNINLAERKGLAVREDGTPELFWRLLKKTASHDKFSTHEYDYYEKLIKLLGGGTDGVAVKTHMFTVYLDEKPIAAEIALTHGTTVYYLHGAMDRDYRALMAPYLMHWEVMKHFKARGYQEYDFWGIDAQRWPGVTRFKLGWGGRQIEYPGAFDLPISKFWYFTYNLARKIL